MPADLAASEADRFLAKHPAIVGIDVLIPDLAGILRGKRLNRDSLAKFYSDGLLMPGALFAQDAAGYAVVESGLVWSEGEADRICRPVPGTLVPSPWADRPLAQAIATMIDLDGSPFAGDPRVVLARALDPIKKMGLTPCVAIELEFYLVDRERDADGRPQPPVSPVTGRRDRKIQVLTLSDLSDFEPFFAAVEAGAAAQGLPLEATISEAAPAQFEVNLVYRPDALAAADHGLMLKRLIKGVAESQGLEATFMAKPYGDQAGSGLHIHVSLLDGDGRNIFDDGTEGGSEALRHAVGGVLATMAETTAIYAPNANSYRRFQDGTYAPTAPLWAYNNRTTAVRIPSGPSKARRIEHRVAGADANISLTVAAVLGGVHLGLSRRIDPGPPIQGNGYEQAPATLPRTWLDALRQFESSAFIADYFGERFRSLYAAVREGERRRFETEITPVELDWYLRNV